MCIRDSSNALAETVADYLGKKLRNAGIQSGGIGVTVGNLSVSHEKEEAFQQYMANRYPEFTILDIAEEGMDPVSYTHLDVYKRQL